MPHEPSSSHHVSVVTADSGARRQLPALDGIRALAIIGVYIFHVWPAVLPGGFKGVDVFFVLSGFLITSIIRKNLADGVFSFREFYLRRVQRLLPNAALTVAATVLFVVVFLPSSIANQAARHGLWSLFNLSNLFAYRYLGDYWGSGAENVPLTHYWSLGVEEQFYILFPLVFFLLWKFLRRWVPLVLIAGAIVSFALCFQMTRVDKITAFYLPQYRFWELLAGAVLACGCNLFERNVGGGHKCLPCNGLRLIGLLSGFLGIILIAISFIYKVPSKTFPREIALLSVLGSVCLIYAVLARGTFFNRLLSLALFTAIGRVSYSLYLWHWPPIVFGGLVCEYYFLNNFDGALARAAGGVISILFAIAAYFLVE
ncbi:MAG: acyltransferase, partial [Puniceicoccales bacterium]|nr:acyltransferase [Puniceicoccales bacterium]